MTRRYRPRPLIAALVAAGAALAGTGCSSGAATHHRAAPASATTTPSAPSTTATSVAGAPAPAVASPPASPPHVMLIVLENREIDAVIGNAGAPTINELARHDGFAAQAFATTHPSLPNYLELISGSTHGISSDCTSCTVSGRTLVDQLDAKGIDWRAFFEAMPSPCLTAPSVGALYAKKHNPFVYFPALVANAAQCQRIVPATSLDQTLAGPAPPPFIWLTPNLCNDGHDCAIGVVDHWLKATLDRVEASPWYAGGGTVIITWDEGSTSASCCQNGRGGHIPTIVVAARLAGGQRLDKPVSQAGILRTIEDVYGLDPLGDAGCTCSGDLHPLL